MTDVRPVGTNNLGALYSFLRVLAVAEASALLPLFVKLGGGDVGEYPTLSAMGLAAIPAFLLTVINYVRPGEIRFGTHTPNVVAADPGDAGRSQLATIGAVLLVVGAVLLLLNLLGVFAGPTILFVVLVVVGGVLVLVDGSSRR